MSLRTTRQETFRTGVSRGLSWRLLGALAAVVVRSCCWRRAAAARLRSTPRRCRSRHYRSRRCRSRHSRSRHYRSRHCRSRRCRFRRCRSSATPPFRRPPSAASAAPRRSCTPGRSFDSGSRSRAGRSRGIRRPVRHGVRTARLGSAARRRLQFPPIDSQRRQYPCPSRRRRATHPVRVPLRAGPGRRRVCSRSGETTGTHRARGVSSRRPAESCTTSTSAPQRRSSTRRRHRRHRSVQGGRPDRWRSEASSSPAPEQTSATRWVWLCCC